MIAPAIKVALPYVPHPTRTAVAAVPRIDRNFQTYVPTVGGYSVYAALPISDAQTFKQKIGTFSA